MKTIHILIISLICSSVAYGQKDLSRGVCSEFVLSVDVASSTSNEKMWHSQNQKSVEICITDVLDAESVQIISHSTCLHKSLAIGRDCLNLHEFTESQSLSGDWKLAVMEILNPMWSTEFSGEVYEADLSSTKWSKTGPSFGRNEFSAMKGKPIGIGLSHAEGNVLSVEPVGDLYISDPNSLRWSKVEHATSDENTLSFPGGSEMKLVEKNGSLYEVTTR